MADRPRSESETIGSANTELADTAPTLEDERPHRGLDQETLGSIDATQSADGAVRRSGERFGRFTILELLGEGGMGRVYSAHDPELDRMAAIKEMRVRSEEPEAMARGQARLLREAQALAKLAHPNVVTVYEVGTVRNGVFVAMEYVEGQTLREWLRTERSWEAIIDCFAEAGRGLAAGHAAGLVHRDFKPDNVLVGDDGRARVIDFGLVRATDEEDESETPLDVSSGSALATPMTRTGALLGTPRYMSPEQHRGRRLDPRSDQFSFCVALYEALYGEPPFAGDTRDALADNVIEGRVRRPPHGAVPRRIERALLRGLSARIDERFESMDALLAQLTTTPALTSRRAAVGVLALATAGLVVAMAVGKRDDPAARCAGFERTLAGVWDANIQAEVSAAFVATKRPHAADTFNRVKAIVGAYTRAWVAARTDACEATHVRGEQSDTLLDRRMACLDTRLADVRALTQLFSKRATGKVVDKAIDTAVQLPDLGPCSDPKVLTALVPPPTDPTVRSQVGALRERLARLAVDFNTGPLDAGLAIAEKLAKESERIDYLPVRAEALLTLAQYQGRLGKHAEAEQALTRSVQLASRARDDLTVARAMVGMVKSVGRQGRVDEAVTVSGLADASIGRASGNLDPLRASLANNLGGLYYAKGRWADARRELGKAADLRKRAHGDNHPRVAQSLHNLAIVAKAQGKYEAARAYHEQALKVREQVLGPKHPQVASSLNSLGALSTAISDYAAAHGYYRRALEIWKGLSPTHPKVGHTYNNMGSLARAEGKYGVALEYHRKAQSLWAQTFKKPHRLKAASLHNIGADYLALGKLDLARKTLEEALAVRKKLLGPSHAQVGMTVNELAGVVRRQGDAAGARAMYEEAAAIWTKSLGAAHPNVAAALINLGEGYRDARDCGKAIPKYQRALEISEKTFKKRHPFIAHALVGLGACAIDTGKAAAAVPLLERAVAMNEKVGQPEDFAVSRFQLGRALWATRGDRARALSLANKAAAVLAKSRKHKSETAAVRAWLKGKR